jgi:subtilisin family serine protease
MRRTTWAIAIALATLAAGALPAAATPEQEAAEEAAYVVAYAEGVSATDGAAALAELGAEVVRANDAVGVATVTSTDPDFVLAAAAHADLEGAVRDRAIGQLPQQSPAERDEVEALDTTAAAGAVEAEAEAEPLLGLQWGNEMIGATPDGSYAIQQGDERVLVGIIDSGIDASHPDLADKVDVGLSRNFTTDIPIIDGPCDEEPDQSCDDPATVDESGHGTHVAGTVGAALNGLGTAGVAPGVTLVNLRAGQDGGYLFLQPVVDAITYAGDIGVDVANMSFYVDPWLFNCRNNPADSPEAQIEQRTIIAAMQRALTYAHFRGVTLIGSAGNNAIDLGRPEIDTSSPDFPPDIAYERPVDNSCLVLPTEGRFVLSVTAVGPSGRKSYYSSYGVEQAELAAPGGDAWDYPGTPQYGTAGNRILSTYPEFVLRENGLIDEAGNPTTPSVIRNCDEGVCGYYAYLQGTSMASPHAAGVAALIVSEYGRDDAARGGLKMRPAVVGRVLRDTATDVACPEPRDVQYITGAAATVNPAYDATCEGGARFNGFFGHGLVDAVAAVGGQE